MKNVSDFNIDAMDYAMSDSHCPIHITISGMKETELNLPTIENDVCDDANACDENVTDYVPLIFKWSEDKVGSFKEGFNENDISNLSSKIDDLMYDHSQQRVDDICSSMCSIFISVAKDVGVCAEKVSTKKRLSKSTKAWFDKDCRAKRDEYFRKKNKLCKVRSAKFWLVAIKNS